jgi:signal transduction histidine kinase
LLFALQAMSSEEWTYALYVSMTQWWCWALMTPAIIALDRRLPFTDRQLSRRIAVHLLLSPVVTAVYLYLLYAVRAAIGLGMWPALLHVDILRQALRGAFLWNWLVYWLILGGRQVMFYYQHFLSQQLRMERLERSFSEARLNALRLQLDPHFLFNVLNTISSQVESDPRLARRMIEQLGDLLRLSLESKNRSEIPLSEELAFLDHYLDIQKTRFGDMVRVEMQIDPEMRRARVPSLFLQPLVENAIRHGISNRVIGGVITIRAWSAGSSLCLSVEDDGAGLPEGWTLETSAGLGLSVTRERILGLHPEGAFDVRPRPGGGTAVAITLPLSFHQEERA